MTHSAPRKTLVVNKNSFKIFRTSFLSVFIASAIASPVFAADKPIFVKGESFTSSSDLSFSSFFHYFDDYKQSTSTTGRYHSGILVEGNGSATLTGKNISANISDLSGVKHRGGADPSLRVFQASNASLTIGNEQTENISVSIAGSLDRKNSMVIGFAAMEVPQNGNPAGNIEINARNLCINLDLGGETVGYGLYAQGRKLEREDGPRVEVNADTHITAKGTNAIGIAAFSSGQVHVNGNLFVNLDLEPTKATALAARGNGSIVINSSGDKTVQINGYIDFAHEGYTSGTPVNGIVRLNLSGSNSFWNGSAYLASGEILKSDKPSLLENQHSLTVSLKDGAVWNPTYVEVMENEINGSTKAATQNDAKVEGVYYASVTQLILDNGVVNVKDNSQPVIVQKLEGKGTINIEATKNDSGLTSGQFHVGSTELDGNKVVATQFNKAEDGTHIDVNFTGVTSDDINSEEFASLARNVQASGATQAHTVKEGLILGDRKQNVDPTGKVVSTSTAENTVNQSLRDIGAMTFLGFRTAINDLDKRLGDLRSYSGENGGWVRYLGGQHRYGDRNMKLNYNGFQAGFDHRFGEFYAGAAFGYTRGSGHLHNGSSDNNNWNFGLYGGWLGEKGQFVDVIVKRHRFKNEFNLHHTSGLLSGGSYHNWATSFSAEAGWRFSCPTTGFYAEPQAELSFGRMEKGSFTTNQGVKVKQNAINSTVGRLGVAAGYTLPEGKGNAYVKASVLHDWSAKVKGSMSKGNLKKSYRDELGGTWAEFSVGGTYNATKNISAYGEFQTSAGSPVRSPWAASVGVRYNF